MWCSLTSWIMPMNSEKAQLSWFRTLLRKEAAMSLSTLSSSAMCLCSSNDGHGSKPIRREKKTGEQAVEAEDTTKCLCFIKAHGSSCESTSTSATVSQPVSQPVSLSVCLLSPVCLSVCHLSVCRVISVLYIVSVLLLHVSLHVWWCSTILSNLYYIIIFLWTPASPMLLNILFSSPWL